MQPPHWSGFHMQCSLMIDAIGKLVAKKRMIATCALILTMERSAESFKDTVQKALDEQPGEWKVTPKRQAIMTMAQRHSGDTDFISTALCEKMIMVAVPAVKNNPDTITMVGKALAWKLQTDLASFQEKLKIL
jgi:hypothetical protein